MKKVISLVIAMLVVFPMAASASKMDVLMADLLEDNVQSFSDVTSSHKNYVSIEWMSDEGTVEGYEDGTFKPDNAVNRAELMKMVVLMSVDEVDLTDSYANCFPDVTTDWYAKYVCYALEQEWVGGYPDGTFKPGNNVNRVEAMKIILNAMIPSEEWPEPTDADLALEMPVDLDMSQWYAGYARFAIAKELVDGWHVTQNEDGTLNFLPEGNMTRKEVAEMLFRVMVYMLERMDYVANMVDSICYYVDNSSTFTEDEMQAGVVQIFEDSGYTEDEMDALTLKYENDNVVQGQIDVYVAEKCGDAAATDQ